ncbi:MAG: glycosyltransferase family 4 protein [Bacteroidales bacterium]|nr:glycosyltransferase family 4 protein [Bacteroidales bacterium]
MRILVVSQYFWPENFRINDFVVGMSQRGHEITVLTGKPNYPSGRFYEGYTFFNRRIEFYNGIKIIRSPLITRGNSGGVRLFINYLSFAFFASVCALFRVKGKYDLILVHQLSPVTVGIPAIILKKRFRIPIFFWVLDLWPESVEEASNIRNSSVIKLLTLLVKYIYKKSDRIFISSRSFSHSICEKNVEMSKIVYFPNWAEELYLSEAIQKSKFASLMPIGFKIMFAGNIGVAQDFESIINAAEIVRYNKEIHWIILGDGRKKQWLKDEIDKRQLTSNFHLLGSYPSEEMPNFFCHADAMLVSLKNSKILSLTVPAKVQSYLAFGKPILAMLNGEGAEIITEAKAGISCESGDYTMLAQSTEKMSNMDTNQLAQMGVNAKTYYNQHFNRKILFEKFENVYSELISFKA